uniref:MAK10-like protein n=1 Tax=Tanacetum cinerariifolium TaxID=118510 RepID=A0A6L2JAE0_TANCI|nr:MAK10-like protein [Tanacetum cinerariifolium]
MDYQACVPLKLSFIYIQAYGLDSSNLPLLISTLTILGLDSESWNDPRDFAKSVKAIALPQDAPNTSDLNKITNSCEICNGPHDTQYCMEIPEQAFVDYASSRTDEAGGLVSKFMASQDARLSKFEADFKQQQSKMTNKIDTVLKAITDRIAGILPSDTVKNPKLGRGFLATANAVIDCRMAKIAVGEGITRLVFSVKGVDLGEEEAPYWTTLRKREAYKPRPRRKGVGTQTPYYARKDFLDCHLPGEWEISRDFKLNPFKDTLVFRIMPPKNRDGAWHAKIRLIDPDGEEFTKTLQSVPTTRKLSGKESPRETVEIASQLTSDAVTTIPVTRLYIIKRSLEILRKFHWMILEGRFNQLSHVSSLLLSKPGEY